MGGAQDEGYKLRGLEFEYGSPLFILGGEFRVVEDRPGSGVRCGQPWIQDSLGGLCVSEGRRRSRGGMQQEAAVAVAEFFLFP